MIPTAEDIMKKHQSKKATVGTDAYGSVGEMFCDYDIEEMMIEFAKLHVEAALKQASEKVKVYHENYKGKHNIDFPYSVDDYSDLHLDKDSILSSYQLDNIQ